MRRRRRRTERSTRSGPIRSRTRTCTSTAWTASSCGSRSRPTADPTRLSLRYSSSVRDAYRTIKVDGRVVAATQRFTATDHGGRWRTLSIDKQLTAGTHTLEVVFDSAADSVGPLNLDNLKVSPSSDTMKQVIAAGTAETNIATETRWPGAASTPYVCCWNTDGQYVKFAFDPVTVRRR